MQMFADLRVKLPIIRQESNGECGLACLVMIGQYYGHKIYLNSIRNEFPTTRQGLNLAALRVVAGKLGLQGRGLAVEDVSDLKSVKLPAILHWQENHFVVLKKVWRNTFVIHDPASGIWSYDRSDFESKFSGSVLELSPAENFSRIVQNQKYPLRNIIRLTHGLKTSITQVAVMTFVASLLTLALPAIVQIALDSVIPKADIDLLKLLTIGVLILSLMTGVAEWLQKRIVLNAGTAFFAQLTHNAVGHIFLLPLRYFERKHPGDIAVRLDSINNIKTVVTSTVVEALVDLSMIIICGLFMYIYMPKLALIVTSLFFVVIAIRVLTIPQLKQLGTEAITEKVEERSRLIDNVRAAAPIKMANATSSVIDRWYNSLVRSSNASFRVGIVEANASFYVEIVTAFGTAITLYLGVLAVIYEQATVGILYAFYTYRGIFFSKIDSLVVHSQQLVMLGVNMAQLRDFLEEQPEHEGSANFRSIRDGVELRDASFRAGFADWSILEAVNIKIPARSGAMIGIAGSSGSGKTTLLKLLTGLYAPSEGDLYVDGTRLKSWGLGAYRENVALLLGSDKLAKGSVREIVSSFEPSADGDQVEQALRDACLWEEIEALPRGYNTVISEENGVLSSGQRRRLMLARAIYRDPAIIFLDEITSNLDSNTAARVLESLSKSTATKVIATHDQSALESCSIRYRVDGRRLSLEAE
jgi:ATP-binding cassette, subfamily B, bacterial CvaB/MchF/RaxB